MKRTASILLVMLALSGSWAYGQQAYAQALQGPDAKLNCTDQRFLQIIRAQGENYIRELALREAADRDLRERQQQWLEKAATPEAPQAWNDYQEAYNNHCMAKKDYYEGVSDTLLALLEECYPAGISLLEDVW